ncbi:Protein kinase domain [Macleaya cordata]|uniref:non-specific serine/threonine protein kinase n=1 Tax=Macleaya cordata TaxID=56857 RepID=A0A200QGU0_MACCD|nr:Protein kinase domain [Macleaya cordata]
MAVSWFIVLCLLIRVSEVVSSLSPLSNDAISLLSLKNSVYFDPSNLLSDWNPSKDYCHWYGVTCSSVSGRVTSLNITGSTTFRSIESRYNFTLEGSVLAGKLSPAVGNLTELRVLSLPYNAFYGEIPVEIGRLQSLEILELQGNNFSGGIPNQLSNLPHLRVLNLSYNLFSGAIPEKLIGFARISAIDLSYNQLNGGIRIDHFSKCQSLVHLKLSGNFLVNKIPPDIGNCSNLRSLLLDENILEGRIPVEIGQISELRILDVSRNSLTDRIPKELGNCRKLSVLVLTNLVDFESWIDSSEETTRGEFNAFAGGIPYEILMLPNLEVFWAPRANLGGRLPKNWKDSCKLRVLNLGQNYITGMIPERMALCQNISFLDLSSNILQGSLPSQLQVPCMDYFNVSHNSLSGSLPTYAKSSCNNSLIASSENNLFGKENIENAYSAVPLWGSRIDKAYRSMLDSDFVILHDFSWNRFISSLPLFSFGDGFLPSNRKPSYWLFLNNNQFNGSLPGVLFTACRDLRSFVVDLSFNNISGGISQDFLFDCLQLTGFKAAYNQIGGSIPPSIVDSEMLQYIDLRGNRLTGSLPDTLGKLKDLKWILLGGNNLTGEIPAQFGDLASLTVLDLSANVLSGIIPSSLANAANLEELLLDHNRLSGEIPLSFSTLASLTKLDVSFNNLSGYIPHLQHLSDCNLFKGNNFLQPCPDPNSAPPAGLPIPLDVHKQQSHKRKLKSFVIVLVASTSFIVLILLTMVLVLVFRRKKLGRVANLKSKVLVTFTDVPTKLNYDNVVRATGNFSVRNLIGTGGFGATYKAELVPGFLVAVKRLAIGRFQGIQQFDAEIRTLGRIRHKNLVTLIGYYMGEAEMFLIYNYLSGGNLETFIHERSGENVRWPVIHNIALDVAQAITYLHYSCVPRIVHRDIKPSNILLDENLDAYLSDFGLARLLEVSETHATTDVAGTFGYVAPEYATTCRVSDKADVYSFGVVLLELMSGKKCLDPSFSEYGNGFNIVAWGNLLIKEGRSSEFFSPELWEAGPKENLLVMLRLASDCTVESLSIRPSMKHVLAKLKQLKIPES